MERISYYVTSDRLNTVSTVCTEEVGIITLFENVLFVVYL
jgi:hypothetical protein